MKAWVSYKRLIVELIKRGRKGASRWREKMGFVSNLQHPSIVFYCHDIGEVKTLSPLVNWLESKGVTKRKVLWVYSKDAYQFAIQNASSLFCQIYYSPYYDQECVKRSLTLLSVQCLVVVESDFTPLYIETAIQAGVPCAAINFSLDHWRDIDLHGYSNDCYRDMLEKMALVTFKTNDIRERFFSGRAIPNYVQSIGNLRYLDGVASVSNQVSELGDALKIASTKTFVLLAGSTYGSEERLLLSALELFIKQGNLHIILAPRKIKKSLLAVRAAKSLGLEVGLRSKMNCRAPMPQVLVLDTMGELSHLYQHAHAAFVGGTIRNKGGHNFFEPAKEGIPIMFGSYYQNNIELASDLLASKGAKLVSTEEEVYQCVNRWLQDKVKRERDGQRVKACIDSQQVQAAGVREALLGLMINL